MAATNASLRRIAPLPDLVWLYQESGALLGYKAQNYQPTGGTGGTAYDREAAAMVPGWVSPPVPGKQHQAAVRTERRIRATLAAIGEHHRTIIHTAYELRNAFTPRAGASRQQAAQYDIGANVVRRVRLGCQAELEAEVEHVAECKAQREAVRLAVQHPGLSARGRLVAGLSLYLACAALQQAREQRGRAEALVEDAERQALLLLADAHRAYLVAKAERKQLAREVRELGNGPLPDPEPPKRRRAPVTKITSPRRAAVKRVARDVMEVLGLVVVDVADAAE